MNTITARHPSIFHTDHDRLNIAKYIFLTIWPAGTEKSSSSTPLGAHVTHRARQKLTSHPPNPNQPPPGTSGRSDGLSGPRGERLSRAGQHNLQWTPSACECQQRADSVSCSISVPTYLHTESDTEKGVVVMVWWGGGRRRGSISGMLPTGAAGQQRKQEKYIFLSRRSPSKALYTSSILRPRLCCFPPPPPCPPLTLSFSHPNP